MAYTFNPAGYSLLDFYNKDKDKFIEDMLKNRSLEGLSPENAAALGQLAQTAGVPDEAPAARQMPTQQSTQPTIAQEVASGLLGNLGQAQSAQPQMIPAGTVAPQMGQAVRPMPADVMQGSSTNEAEQMAQSAQGANQQAAASSAALKQNRDAQMADTEQQASNLLQEQIAKDAQADSFLGSLIGLGLNIATGGLGGFVPKKTWKNLL
jgi:hypothetical protein